MNEQWEAKRDRAPGTVIAEMDALRDRALSAGALGAVPLGAGGGGFVLVYTPDRSAPAAPWTPPSWRSAPTRPGAWPRQAACGPVTRPHRRRRRTGLRDQAYRS